MLYIDRIFLHELTGASAMRQLENGSRRPRRSDSVFVTIDHVIDTAPGRTKNQSVASLGSAMIQETTEAARRYGFTLFDADDRRQGIVHVISPDLGIALPGVTLVCGDSHTSTVGGVGAIGFGIGSTDCEQILASQTLALKRPRAMRIWVTGILQNGVYPKDLILDLIRNIGANGGLGFAVEFAGPAIAAMSVEGRLTLCNMATEFGAKFGFVAPDEQTFNYLVGRNYAPHGRAWDEAVEYWKSLTTDTDATFDREVSIDCACLEPQITWGTSPQHVVGVASKVPEIEEISPDQRSSALRALDYMHLKPGQQLEGLPVDAAYIGACTNARLADLQAAGSVLRGRRVHPSVLAICVPGSREVKEKAEAEGLHAVFKSAGFEWHEAGCGLCGHMGNDRLKGLRVVSTTNRNFVGRQGPGTMTHLASPVTVAASAILGGIADIRKMENAGSAL
ncbi:3-isopropylmalate dehydratase large subunit (plasmid) [Allorhizobium ampelinum S4]|uniref:3-isopropylmalate dehydratase n=1 Tax=Allorhizobium ampelinum (strain ATCC BAA-846 / DSM 112012 / S4) TaxID=311402 RepID=B9K397_ALLAM|nr:3-isopropylmalate dehydratase large subunit [Allorhizobium ampelinum S4]